MNEKKRFMLESGWMIISTSLGGLCMWLVHVPTAYSMSSAEYGLFVMFLQMMNLWMIPALGLQTIFAHQTASSIDEESVLKLRSTVRSAIFLAWFIWVIFTTIVIICYEYIVNKLKIQPPYSIWIMCVIGLAMLWWPILQGVLQGRQKFFWLGLLQIINGFTRLTLIIILVSILKHGVVGALIGACCGFWLCVFLAGWQCLEILAGKGNKVDWKRFLAQALPLSLGLGTAQFMMSADQIAVQIWFPAELTGYYGAAATIGRALVFFTMPLVMVVFPKIVRASVLGKYTSVPLVALTVAGLMGGCAAVFFSIFPKLPLQLIYKESYWHMHNLIPWFVWAMWPLCIANVLVALLLGIGAFKTVPWLGLVAIGYGTALTFLPPKLTIFDYEKAFRSLVAMIGLFNLCYLGVCVKLAFRWLPAKEIEIV